MSTNPPPEAPGIGTKAGIAAAIAAAVAVAAPLTGLFEGFAPKAAPDPIGILTGCFGERVDMSDLDPNKIYTRSECTDRLREAMGRKYAPKIAECLPQLTAPERRNEFAALIDTSYNAGPVAVCKSPMARHIRAGHWISMCSSIRNFYVGSITDRPARGAMESRRLASGRYFNKFRGLVKRRAAFADLCMRPE